jgi:hypothetical protein
MRTCPGYVTAPGATGYDDVVERIQAAERLNPMACVAKP